MKIIFYITVDYGASQGSGLVPLLFSMYLNDIKDLNLSGQLFMFADTYIHIHNWPFQSFSQNYGLASHVTHVVCINFIRTTKFLRRFFNAGLFTLRVFARNRLGRNCRRNIFFIFCFDDWPGIRTRAFKYNNLTHYLLDHGDFWRCLFILSIWSCLIDKCGEGFCDDFKICTFKPSYD